MIIIHPTPDGGVAETAPNFDDPAWGGRSPEEIVAFLLEQISGSAQAPHRLLAPEEAAAIGDKYRDAWRFDDSTAAGVTKDVAKAREIELVRLRVERTQRLDATDKEFLRLLAVGTAEQKQALDAYRQQLRDLPATEAAKIEKLTVDELEAYRPAWPGSPA